MTEQKPSKSERKRRQQALRALGERLIDLDEQVLEALGLDERLRSALADARRMRSREALRRQKQYIGKLMRSIDTDPIEAHFQRIDTDEGHRKRLFADAERWRSRLLEDAGAVAEFESRTASEQTLLARLLTEYEATPADRERRRLSREIFRAVHAALVAASAAR